VAVVGAGANGVRTRCTGGVLDGTRADGVGVGIAGEMSEPADGLVEGIAESVTCAMRERVIGSPRVERGLKRAWRARAGGAGDAASGCLVDRVMRGRGLLGTDAPAFLSPSLMHLHDPGLLPGVERAAERVLEAAARGEPIAIFGDYDVDGITATAILFHTLRLLAPGADVRTYVPHRLEEGYGLSGEALVGLAREGVRVVVSVDCGITACDAARAARGAGIDLVITDHHTPPSSAAELPECVALVHPRLPGAPGPAYPFGELCGAGVAYKLAWRLCTMAAGGARVPEAMRRHLIDMLVPAALGTIADVVPLVGENRVIARHGLALMKRCSIEGLRALIAASRLDSDRIEAEDVGFRIAPRLNAAGRLGHAREAVELLTTATGERAHEIARELSRLNDQRRATEKRIAEQAAERALACGMAGGDGRIIVLADEGWHRGVVGIACSRLVERFGRPTVLLQREGDVCAGSGRSIAGYDLHAALESCRDLLEKFGGHAMAAGLSVKADRVDELAARLQAHAGERLGAEDMVCGLEYDAAASLGELDEDAVGTLASLGPFGAGNPRVRVLVRGARLAQPVRALGNSGEHVALTAAQDGRTMRLVAWGFGALAQGLRMGQHVDVVVEPKFSTFNGQRTVEPEVADLRVCDGAR
jgi:single-stranded-DNA-specific exonuclease